MLTRAARAFANEGYRVLRFDFAGRGDSDGDTESATLATMADDVHDVLQWCAQEKQVSQVVLVGLCSGCEVALAAATRNSHIDGMALWSAPVFAAGESSERKGRKRLHYAKEYARKLLRPSTYAKIVAGRLDTKSIGKALSGGGGAENKNREADVAGQLPPGWRSAALKRFEKWSAPMLLFMAPAIRQPMKLWDGIVSRCRDACSRRCILSRARITLIMVWCGNARYSLSRSIGWRI
jgi:pimeloyl-ACP methyl ester carboxylesterase